MLLKDLMYWHDGKPPYTVVLEDEKGHPIGIVYTDGTVSYCSTSSKSEDVVWDGGSKDPNGGHSKGRLLPVKGPAYIDSLTRLRYLSRGDNDENETEGGAGKSKPRKKKTDKPKGKQKA